MRPSALPILLLPLAGFALTGQAQCGDPVCDDADGDGVCDEADLCPRFNDAIDADDDGVPDACDVCPTGQDSQHLVCADTVPAAVSVRSMPQDHALLQRKAGGTCVLTVEGVSLEGGMSQAWLQGESEAGIRYEAFAPVVYDALGGAFSVSIEIPAGLDAVDFGASLISDAKFVRLGGSEDVVCGDVILVQGQSNAVAGDYHGEGITNTEQSRWIRSFGTATTDAGGVTQFLDWGTADGQGVHSALSVGAWALHMAAQLVETEGIPIALINGAVGGTTIAQHQRRDGDPEATNTIYGRFLYRAREARIDQVAQRMFWYQGESDGADGVNYLPRWDALYSDWKADFPALQEIIVFQVRDGCGLTHPFDALATLDFYTAEGALLQANPVVFSAGATATGADWKATSLTRTAPPAAQLAIYAFAPNAVGSVDFDDGSFTAPGGAQRLLNPGFETGSGGLPSDWLFTTTAGASWGSGAAHGGSRFLSLDGASGAIAYQIPVVTAGESITASIFTRATSPAPYLDVREALRRLPGLYPDITLMSTTAAPGHDGCHFLTSGYWELGDRAARLMASSLYGAPLAAAAVAPTVSAIVQEGPDTLRVSFAVDPGPLTVDAGVEAYFRVPGAVVMGVSPAGSGLRISLDRAIAAPSLSFMGHAFDGPGVRTALGVGLPTFMDVPLTP